MSLKSQFSRQRVFWEALTITAFLILLWMPTLDHFFHFDHAPETVENRRPAPWPEFDAVMQTRNYIAGLESYFNDHFGFRKRLIRWDHHWKEQLFGGQSSSEVLVGRDGWLFYRGQQMVENWWRQTPWTAENLEHWRQLLEMRRDWLRER